MSFAAISTSGLSDFTPATEITVHGGKRMCVHVCITVTAIGIAVAVAVGIGIAVGGEIMCIHVCNNNTTPIEIAVHGGEIMCIRACV